MADWIVTRRSRKGSTVDETGAGATAPERATAPAMPAVLPRALMLASACGLLSRGRSILPRTPQDQVLISTGAGLMGAAAGVVAEGATVVTARLVPGPRRRGRVVATGLLAGLAGGALAWASRRRPDDARAALVDTARRVGVVATVGGELSLALHARLPAPLRSNLTRSVWATGLAAGSALRALRRRLAEPGDLVMAGIGYEFLPTVSGGEGSLLPVAELDREGRKFLGCAVSAARIAEVVGGVALDPIRVYAGLGSASSPVQRARLAVAELGRLGGLERSRIVLYCPTGSGFVNPIAAASEELMSRGDVASVAFQYSNKRSVRARKHLGRARETWWLLLEELDRALAPIPAERRPEIIVYGESLGAQVVAEVLSEGGTETMRSFNIARGALMGLPFDGMQKLRALRQRGEPLPGGLGVFSDLERLTALPFREQEAIRYLIFTHAEDPVANFSGTRLLWERPGWLRPEGRHLRLPAGMRWLPGITYLHVMFDIKNGTSFGPAFDAYAHDYRRELPTLLRIAFGHSDVTGEELRAVERETARAAVDQAERERGAHVGAGAA